MVERTCEARYRRMGMSKGVRRIDLDKVRREKGEVRASLMSQADVIMMVKA